MEDFEQPSTSKKAYEMRNKEQVDKNSALPPTIKDDEAEIARLEESNFIKNKSATDEPDAEDERIAQIKFNCASCDMTEMVHYFGKNPNFAYGVDFIEDTYVMRDPFQPPPPRWKPKAEYFIAIGAHCSNCGIVVCKDSQCSFFYTRSFCLNCAEKQIKLLPPEAQVKLRKQLAAKGSS